MPSLMLVPLAVSMELKQTHRQVDRIALYGIDNYPASPSRAPIDNVEVNNIGSAGFTERIVLKTVKKVGVFSHSQISFRNINIVFETQLVKEHLRGFGHCVGLHIATSCLQVSGTPELVLQLKAYHNFGRALKCLICIFRIKLLNSRPITYSFIIGVWVFV